MPRIIMDKPFRRVFIEITNVCNLACGFCAVSSRPAAFMDLDSFKAVAAQVKPFASVVSLHVLGEPFMHPRLRDILRFCSDLGLKINLVTNGTLLDKFGPALFAEKCLSQVSVSLHALAALEPAARRDKLRLIEGLAKTKPEHFKLALRLRGDRTDPVIKEISDYFLSAFPGGPARVDCGRAEMLRDNVYLNFGELFTWREGQNTKRKGGCLGLRHHFAVLCGGEVVPCCADYDGRLAFGNLNVTPLAGILRSPAAAALRSRIAARTPVPAYCRRCGFRAP